jgi:hypothetical protein
MNRSTTQKWGEPAACSGVKVVLASRSHSKQEHAMPQHPALCKGGVAVITGGAYR